WNFTSLTCCPFSSPTILGCHCPVNRANFSARLTFSMPVPFPCILVAGDGYRSIPGAVSHRPRRWNNFQEVEAMSLQGKVALVTGSSRGIGRAVAERLSRDGAAVVVNYAAGAGPAHEVVAGIEKAGGRALAVQADVSKVADVKRLFDATFERFGRLDILVN